MKSFTCSLLTMTMTAMTTLIFAGVSIETFVSTSAAAEEDLLSILDGKKEIQTPDIVEVQKSPLRKLFENLTAEQNIFFQFFEKEDFEKALYQWPAAFSKSEFNNTDNGLALQALLLFKNGLTVVGLEKLFTVLAPKNLDNNLVQIWRRTAPETHKVWGTAILENWVPEWTDLFSLATEVRVRGRQTFQADRIDFLKVLLAKTQPGSQERAWIEWQLTVALVDVDPTKAALALSHLLKVENNPVSVDLMNMTAARLLFQNGFLDASIKYYEKVPKASEHWFEAQEEMGWAYVRKGEPQNAIAITKTLARSEFIAIVGPETLFLRSLSQLKICDYPAVVASLQEYQTHFRDRAKELLGVTADPNTPAVQKLLSKLKVGPVALNSLGSDSRSLPRYITRDHILTQLLGLQTALEGEAKIAGELYARSLSNGTADVGFQAPLEEFRHKVEGRVQTARSQTLNRIKTLAQEEVDEISLILQKMHIVEAEVLQQTLMAQRVIGATENSKQVARTGSTGSHAPDGLTFPTESEVWFDELANYKVDVKNGCQAIKK